MESGTESARLWEPGLPGVELFEAQLFRHRFGKHFHEAYTIGLNEAGRGCCQHHGEEHTHYPGSFNLINPGDLHTGQVASSTEGWRFRNIYIDLSLIEQISSQLEGAALPYFKAPVVWEPALRSIFYQLFQTLAGSPSRLAQQSLLLDLLSQLFLVNGERPLQLKSPQSESRAILQTRTYLEAHYAENVSIEDLAQLVNLSPYYLIRCFRRQVGCPPHQYQRHWQLVNVKQALRVADDGGSLSAIATDHGFYDQSHLNRAFKQTFGVTPGQYQRQHQKGNFVQYV